MKELRNIMLAGALGDAFGWLVEFKNFDEIKATYGEDGLLLSKLKDGAYCTDDTQMTLFLAEVVKGWRKPYNSTDFRVAAHKSFYRWFLTQNSQKSIKEDTSEDLYPLGDFEKMKRGIKNKKINIEDNLNAPDFSLLNYAPMWKTMAPGNTCLSALHSKKIGTIESPINDSMGCGSIMRVAPVLGLLSNGSGATIYDVLDAAYNQSAITHGNAEGIFVTGLYTIVLKNLMDGQSKENALDNAIKFVFDKNNDKYGLLNRIPSSVREYLTEIKGYIQDPKIFNGYEMEEKCGAGWVTTSCFGLAYYAFCKSKSFAHCLELATNHGGDSDSTASIAGQLYAAHYPTDFSDCIKTDLNDVILKFTEF